MTHIVWRNSQSLLALGIKDTVVLISQQRFVTIKSKELCDETSRISEPSHSYAGCADPSSGPAI
jgi:hypothetical protein